MPKTISEIRKSLQKSVPKDHLKDRNGPGGKKLYYVEGDYVNYQLNEIFGVENVDIVVRELVLEAENRFTKVQESQARRNPETRQYEAVKQDDIPQIEFTYRATVAVIVTVIDEQGGVRTFTREGVGTGLGTSANLPTSSHHQARQTSIKYAETDALKRAAKKIGAIFGLSIGENGAQSLAVDTDEPYEDEAPANLGVTTPGVSSVLSNESDPKPASAPAASSTPPAPAENPKAAVSQQAPKSEPEPRAPALNPTPAPTKAQEQQPAAKTSTAPVGDHSAKPPVENAAQTTTSPVDANTGDPAIPEVDVQALEALNSIQWLPKFKELNNTLGESRSLEAVSKIARTAGSYFALVSKSQILEPDYKANVEKTMRNYLTKHIERHQLRIDIEAEILNGRKDVEVPAAAEELTAPGPDAFQPPF